MPGTVTPQRCRVSPTRSSLQLDEDLRQLRGEFPGQETGRSELGSQPVARAAVQVATPDRGLARVGAASDQSGHDAGLDVTGAGGAQTASPGRPQPGPAVGVGGPRLGPARRDADTGASGQAQGRLAQVAADLVVVPAE